MRKGKQTFPHIVFEDTESSFFLDFMMMPTFSGIYDTI